MVPIGVPGMEIGVKKLWTALYKPRELSKGPFQLATSIVMDQHRGHTQDVASMDGKVLQAQSKSG